MNFVKRSANRFTYRTNCRKQPGFGRCSLVIEKVENLWKLVQKGFNRQTGELVSTEIYESQDKEEELKFWRKI